MECNCRCINCKSPDLTSKDFISNDGYEDSHHTCQSCRTHFNHLDGEQYTNCEICGFEKGEELKKSSL